MAYQDARKDYLTKCAVEALGATTPSSQWATSPESMYSAVPQSVGDAGLPRERRHPDAAGVHDVDELGRERAGCARRRSASNRRAAARRSSSSARTSGCARAELMAPQVVMSSLGDSPLQTLQLNIKELFAPMLLKDPQWTRHLDSETRHTLEALNSALTAALQKAGGEDDYSNILSPHAECQHWRRIHNGEDYSASADQRAQAQQYWDALQPVSDLLGRFHELTFSEMGRLLSEMRSTLEELTACGYRGAHEALHPDHRLRVRRLFKDAPRRSRPVEG